VAADRRHAEYHHDPEDEQAYLWFEGLAEVLNNAMRDGVDAGDHGPLLQFLDGQFTSGGPGVRDCLDVAFVENLFWEVPAALAAPHWHRLPEGLKSLYLGFHGRAPT
jgi:hypothetical protein